MKDAVSAIFLSWPLRARFQVWNPMQQPMACVALTPELISCEETASCIKDNLSRSMNELSSYQLLPPIGSQTLASVKVLLHSAYVWSPSKTIVCSDLPY